MALYYIDSQSAYDDYAVDWGTFHNWAPAWGMTADPTHADNMCAGQTYLELYQIDPQPQRIANIKTVVDGMVNSTKIDNWTWIDALHMAMPVFAKLLGREDPRGFYAAAGVFLASLMSAERALLGLPPASCVVGPTAVERPEICEGCQIAG